MTSLKTEHNGSKKGNGAHWGFKKEAKQFSKKERRFRGKAEVRDFLTKAGSKEVTMLTHQQLIDLGLEAPKHRRKKKPKRENLPEYSIGETVYVRSRWEKEGLLEVLLVDHWTTPGPWKQDHYFGIVQRTTKRNLDYLVGHLRHIENRPYFGDDIVGRDPEGFELALKRKK